MSIIAMIANHHEHCNISGQLDEVAFVESAAHPNRLQRLIDTILFQLWHNTIVGLMLQCKSAISIAHLQTSSDGDVFRRQMKQYRQELSNSRQSIVEKVKNAVARK